MNTELLKKVYDFFLAVEMLDFPSLLEEILWR